MQLALEVISQTMFTVSMAQHIDQISHALRVSLKYAFDSFHNPLRLPSWVPTQRNREFRSVMQFMDGLIYGLLAEFADQDRAGQAWDSRNGQFDMTIETRARISIRVGQRNPQLHSVEGRRFARQGHLTVHNAAAGGHDVQLVRADHHL